MSENKIENNEDLFEYNEKWDSKNLAPELVLTNYNYKLISQEQSLDKFTDWTQNRHRTYPTNDVLIENFDKSFATIYDSIVRHILFPSLNKLYDCEISNDFKHETFIVRYKPELQGHLDLHHDSSNFTFCVTFSAESDYEGGGTWFPKHNTLLKAGQGVVAMHPGLMTHQHGVRPIVSGQRYAMVSFCKLQL